MTAVCDHPAYSPTPENRSGGCGEPATRAMALGDTGRWLPLCDRHALPRKATIPLDQVPEA